ncbi:unnamed protein product, partial [Peniophora sp. CBMAI 1063]
GQDARMERVLGRIRAAGQVTLDSIASLYSGSDDGEEGDGDERSETPTNRAYGGGHSRTDSQQRVASPLSMALGGGSRNATPVQYAQPPHLRSMSAASVMSGESGYRTAIGSPVPSSVAHSSSSGHGNANGAGSRANTTTPTQSHNHAQQNFGALGNGMANGKPKVYIPHDDFGVSRMLAIIELAGLSGKAALLEQKERERKAKKDGLEDVLFGPDLRGVMRGLHPSVREVYEGGVRGLEEMDRALDEVLEGLKVGR